MTQGVPRQLPNQKKLRGSNLNTTPTLFTGITFRHGSMVHPEGEL
jgi:hypothetical protein